MGEGVGAEAAAAEEDPPLPPLVGVVSSEFVPEDDDVELQPQSTRKRVSFTGMKVPAPVRSPDDGLSTRTRNSGFVIVSEGGHVYLAQ